MLDRCCGLVKVSTTPASVVRAEIVEDGEVEDLERQQRGGQAEQLAGGTGGERFV